MTTALDQPRSTGLFGRLFGHQSFSPPRKALILQPCCLGRVIQTTPLLAALSLAYPATRFDWAVSDWASPAVSTNPRVTRIIRTGPGQVEHNSRDDNQALIDRLRQENYDTCFIPSYAPALKQLARRAGIPQRISLSAPKSGRMTEERNIALTYLSLARAAGVDQDIIDGVEIEYEPPDRDRTAVTRWLVEEVDWLGDAPLVVIHPGGGENPERNELNKRWPAVRFARLANHLMRTRGARVILAGTAADQPVAAEVAGMMANPVANRAGTMGLGELGALCELSALYAGNDIGASYIAAATGCPTLMFYGPTNPVINGPHIKSERVIKLWHPYDGHFSWQDGVTVEEAVASAEALLASPA